MVMFRGCFIVKNKKLSKNDKKLLTNENNVILWIYR